MPNPSSNSNHPKSRAEWRKWLEENHARTEGIWLISYKKATGKPRFDYDDAVEEALCFGWVDSKPNKLDDSCCGLHRAKQERAGRNSTSNAWRS